MKANGIFTAGSLLVFSLLYLRVAEAAVFEVDTTVESNDPLFQVCNNALANDCSLRGAIIKANTIAGQDTVKVPAGIYALSLPAFDETAQEGDLDITESLIVRGLGGVVTIDGTLTGQRVFDVWAAAGSDVRLKNLTITGGQSNDGAGVKVEPGAGEVRILDSVVEANDSGSHDGGGVYNAGTLIVRNSTIQNNLVTSLGAFNGAGIFNAAGGIFTLENSTISGNTGAVFGGGFYNRGTAELINSTITQHTVSQFGAGLINFGTLTIRNSTVSDNTANGVGVFSQGGGGIANVDPSSILTIRGGRIENNSAPNATGGGLQNGADAQLEVRGNALILNNSAIDGGGVAVQGPLTFNRVTLRDNQATFDGGGMYIVGDDIDLTNLTVRNNSAGNNGGGIYFAGEAMTLDASLVVNNEAANFGGGIYSLNSAPGGLTTISNSTIRGNSATSPNGEGGGIFHYTNDMVLDRVWIQANHSEGNGGGIKHTDGKLTIYGSTISNNTALNNGAGIQNDFDNLSTTVSLTNSTISRNVATGNGGGIFSEFDFGTAEVYLFNVTIAQNDALASLSDGVFMNGGLLRSNHSIIGQNVTAGADCLAAAGAVIQAPGNNLEQGVSCGFSLNAVFPGLNGLANNGGPTPTHALQAASPALGAGNPVLGCMGDQDGDGVEDYLLVVDQRDQARGIPCDLGAYELP